MTKSPTTPPASLTAASKKLWKQILDDWQGFDDSASLKILEVGLLALDRAESATKQIGKDGATVVDRWKQVKPHPLLPVERDSRSLFLNTMKQLKLDIAEGTK